MYSNKYIRITIIQLTIYIECTVVNVKMINAWNYIFCKLSGSLPVVASSHNVILLFYEQNSPSVTVVCNQSMKNGRFVTIVKVFSLEHLVAPAIRQC